MHPAKGGFVHGGAFFRRTVAEKKKYRCNHEKRREITSEIRNFCRKCRFDKCLKAGMRAEKVQLTRDKTRNIISSIATSKKIWPSPPEPRILDRLMEGYKLYTNAHKSIFAAMYPELTFADAAPMVEIPIFEKLQLDKAIMPNIYIVLRDFFSPYAAKMASADKKDVSKIFIRRFIQMDRAYLTSVYFPEDADDRIANSHNHFMRYKNIKFAEEEDDFRKIMDHNLTGAFTPYGKRMRRLCKKVKKLRLDVAEMVGVMGILNCEEVYIRTSCKQALEERGQLLKELHSYIRRKGFPDSDIRFGQLLLLNRDVELVALTFWECIYLGMVTDDGYKEKIDQLRELLEKL
uniref:Nuclear receptor domain-containing protein n=1 Tax=Bursaphelenchus xylophilus TaxID=6326 RepID=A0A1I7SI69_BURXY